ncbi:hypothetical protein [Bacteroides sp.]
MKRLRYILAAVLSLMIIYAGVGVSVVHYCCAACETAQTCCSSGCSKCHKAHHQPDKSCKDEGCTATVYKVDLIKHSCEVSATVPVIQLLCEQILRFHDFSSIRERQEVPYNVPPYPVSSRYYLSLYSTLLI